MNHKPMFLCKRWLAAVLLAWAGWRPLPAELVELVSLDSSIRLDIRYATSDNFVGRVLYPSARCLLEAAPARALVEVQAELRPLGLGIKVFDGYRPLAVQKIMWAVMPDERFVADPAKGSKHNRATAVDLTLVDLASGCELSMPSGYDEFSEKAGRDYAAMAWTARLPCKLLELVMEKHGFVPLPSEWWHFDFRGWEGYPVLDIPIGPNPAAPDPSAGEAD